MKIKKTLSALVVGMFSAFLIVSLAPAAFATATTETPTAVVDSITLTDNGDGNVSWTVDGYSQSGFKVAWSKNQGPTYPTRTGDNYQYLSSPEANSTTLTAFDEDGTYYVRVCEYLGGACGTYSNEIQVQLGAGSIKLEATTATAPEKFTDVSSSDENYEAIIYLKTEEIVEGYDDGSYKPEQTINRAEFLKIVMETKQYSLEGQENCFKDVTYEWYAPYVCKAKDLGLVEGYADGYYRPDREINFAEASKIVVEAFMISTEEVYDENWYQKYITALEDVFAIPATIESFGENITRGEMSEIVWRIDAEKTDQPTLTYSSIKDETLVTVTKEVVAPVEEEEEEEEEEVISSVKSMTVTDDGEGVVSWTIDGASEDGYKVVWSLTSAPTYPTRSTDKYTYISDPFTKTATLDAFDGDGTYYVRVCEYLGGECGVYSNEIQVELTTEVTSAVNSLTLSHDGAETMSWVIDGTSESGFKLVWSLTSEPTYPTRSTDKYAYYSSSTTTTGEIDAFDGDGTYYVRVCEYLGGECGVYSNEVQVELTAEAAATVNSLTLSHDGAGVMSWVVDGTSESGFKLVWSLTSGPTYPTRGTDKYAYYSDSATISGTIDSFDGAGTYHVRVCEYLGGECGIYSNEVQVEML